ncbi:hypothetical protein FPZ24_00845 [Sphingomonas panacisoli]|uniref:Uncharacterized protein n=1 Tax=Sphingomonas panacisoli TaxID=1813879 RepID=A0A5B8LDL7_9SPHN|nr:hypothetical protein [Sphingomonas panacisoli]QDZ06197.1 hypothetical protein FPZ24_00845 [Sphingomonas panacisoli]
MRGGIWVLTIMAAVWGVAAIMVGHAPTWLVVIPIAISLALLFWASRQPVGTGNPVEGGHVGRVVGIATGIEGVAIFVAANVLINLHLPTLVMPAIAIIVGLHFIPLARWIPVALYYRTGGALIAVGAATSFFPPEQRASATGAGAAVVLWASCILLVRQGRG